MSVRSDADVVICGAGIAGAAAAYFLAVEHGQKHVCLVDEGPPLSLTSDKSTECYRNWWPGPGSAMVDFSNRSIDLLENIARRTNNRIAMARRGYVFATGLDTGVEALRAQAESGSALGSGDLREHGASTTSYIPHTESGWENSPAGIDLLTDPKLIQQHFPGFSKDTKGLLHVRRCGWLTAQQLGAWYLEEARAAGARIVSGKLVQVDRAGGRVAGVTIAGEQGEHTINTERLVLSPGPYLHDVGQLLGLDLPVYCEGHVKVVLRDTKNGMPADSPLVLWMDPVRLPWSDEEREALAEDTSMRYLLDEFPGGVHGRPTGVAGHHYALMLWTYDVHIAAPTFPMAWDPHMPEIIIRGISRMLPGMNAYLDALPKTEVDGGYYCKTPENRPLVGPLPVEGAYVNAAYSGYGIMTSCAGGELIANHIMGATLPSYADALLPSRFDDPNYLDEFADATAGQM